MAILGTVTLVMGLTSLVGCGGNQGLGGGGGGGGPRGSEEATIRVRNGSLVVELRDEPDAEWVHDPETLEWTQKDRSRPQGKPDLDLVINTTATCSPFNNPRRLRVIHGDGTTVELKLQGQKTRVKMVVVSKGTKQELTYPPLATRDNFIKEIWVNNANSPTCTFTESQPLVYMDLKR
jgi:hypothetical protein